MLSCRLHLYIQYIRMYTCAVECCPVGTYLSMYMYTCTCMFHTIWEFTQSADCVMQSTQSVDPGLRMNSDFMYVRVMLVQ